MNPHSVTETLRRFMAERLPGLAVQTPLDNGELLLPYVLVHVTADSEKVVGNGTWDMSVSLELHTNAHEQGGEEARYSGADVVRVLCAAGARKDINEAAEDFFLYSLKLAALDRAEVQDDSFVQHAEFRAVVQF